MLKYSPTAAYSQAKDAFGLFVNTNLSPFPGHDLVKGLCGKHILFKIPAEILHMKCSYPKWWGQMFSFRRDPYWSPSYSALQVSI